MPKMKAVPDWLRVMPSVSSNPLVAVDRDKKIIFGRVVAQLGPFKSEGRGEFNRESLAAVVSLMNKREPKGTRARYTHPTVSSDGLGTFLGRDHNARMDTALRVNGDGSTQQVLAVRSDLHLDPTSFETPNGNLGKYVLDLAESDPDAFSSSLVLKADEEPQLDQKGRLLVDDETGELLPPIWKPRSILAVDAVDTGDAVDGFLSFEPCADDLPDAIQRRGAEMLDRFFVSQSREAIQKRCLGWLNRYLELRFGALPPPPTTPKLDALRKRLEENSLTVNRAPG